MHKVGHRERLWRPFRHAVTHNHRRDQLTDLHDDAQRCFAAYDRLPERVLSFIASPFAPNHANPSLAA